VAARAPNFSGAELEQVVVEGLYLAFAQGVELATVHLLTAVAQTFPLAVTLAEEVERLRVWASRRTRPASRKAGAPA